MTPTIQPDDGEAEQARKNVRMARGGSDATVRVEGDDPGEWVAYSPPEAEDNRVRFEGDGDGEWIEFDAEALQSTIAVA